MNPLFDDSRKRTVFSISIDQEKSLQNTSFYQILKIQSTKFKY